MGASLTGIPGNDSVYLRTPAEEFLLKAAALGIDAPRMDTMRRLPEAVQEWSTALLQLLVETVPYVGKYQPQVDLPNYDPNAGYGFGSFVLRPQMSGNNLAAPGLPDNRVRVPIVIRDFRAYPFDLMEVGGTYYLLTESALARALYNPNIGEDIAPIPATSPNIAQQQLPPMNGMGMSGLGFPGMMPSMIRTASDPASDRQAKRAAPDDDLIGGISGTIYREDADRLTSHLNKHASALEGVASDSLWSSRLHRLLSGGDINPGDTYATDILSKAASAPPTVIQVSYVPTRGTFLVKTANPDAWAPETTEIGAQQAMAQMPGAAQQAMTGMPSTLTTDPSSPDPLVEAVAPITGYGNYKCHTTDGAEVIGIVIPGLYDAIAGNVTPFSLFTNGSSYALHPGALVGTMLGITWSLPTSQQKRGLGIFYRTNGRAIMATVPYTIESENTLGMSRMFSATDMLSGTKLQITTNSQLNSPQFIASPMNAPLSGGAPPLPELQIPADFQWLPLNNALTLQGVESDMAAGTPEMPGPPQDPQAAQMGGGPVPQDQAVTQPPPMSPNQVAAPEQGGAPNGQTAGDAQAPPPGGPEAATGPAAAPAPPPAAAPPPGDGSAQQAPADQGAGAGASGDGGGDGGGGSGGSGEKKKTSGGGGGPTITIQMKKAQMDAAHTRGHIRADLRGHIHLSGPAFEKVASGTLTFDQAMFYLVGAGFTQADALRAVKEAAARPDGRSWYNLRTLTPPPDERLVKLAGRQAAQNIHDRLFATRDGQALRPGQQVKAAAEVEHLSYMVGAVFNGSNPDRLRDSAIKLAAVMGQPAGAAVTHQMYEKVAALTADLSHPVDVATVDSVLSLGFINPENIAKFYSYLPLLEKSSTSLAALLLASRLGLNAVGSDTVKSTLITLDRVISALRMIAPSAR